MPDDKPKKTAPRKSKRKSKPKPPPKPAACAHASRAEPCWGDVLGDPAACAGHYYVDQGGRYIRQGERQHFAARIAKARGA